MSKWSNQGRYGRFRLLLLDEPSLGLAPILIAEIFKTLRTLNKEHGMTLLVVELIVPVAMEKGVRFAIREGGRTVGAGTVTEIVE